MVLSHHMKTSSVKVLFPLNLLILQFFHINQKTISAATISGATACRGHNLDKQNARKKPWLFKTFFSFIFLCIKSTPSFPSKIKKRSKRSSAKIPGNGRSGAASALVLHHQVKSVPPMYINSSAETSYVNSFPLRCNHSH